MATEKKSDKQVMDVSKPGKTPAEASSRPIILGHKPQIQDPMVNTAEDPNPNEPVAEPEMAVPTPTAASGSKRVIAPISEPETTETTPPSEEKTETTQTEGEASQAEDQQSSESAEVDVVADQVGSRKLEEQQTEEERKKQEALDKLIAEKKYFVPIGKAHRKRNARWMVILALFLVIASSGLLLAADAGLVNLGFKPPIDFFKDNTSETITDTSQTKPPDVVATPPAAVEAPKATLSGEVLEYSDKNLGFKFSYPKEWGKANTVPGPENAHLIKGSELQVTFESNDKATLDVKTKDWEHDPDRGHGGVVYGGAYIGETPTSIVADDSLVKMFFTKDNSFIAGMPFSGETCRGIGYLGIKALPANHKYEGIAILSYETNSIPDENICDSEKYEALLTTAGYDVIKKLFDSIQVL